MSNEKWLLSMALYSPAGSDSWTCPAGYYKDWAMLNWLDYCTVLPNRIVRVEGSE